MSVTIIHGCNKRQFSIAGLTVAETALRLRDVFKIPRAISASVNGQAVEVGHILRDGDTLEFVAGIGVKSGLHDFWSETELAELFGQEQFDVMRQAGLNLPHNPFLHDNKSFRGGNGRRQGT